MSINNESGYREVGYELRDLVPGAFKASINFSNFSATVAGTVEAGFLLEFRVDDNNYARISRYKTGGGSNGYRADVYSDGAAVASDTVTLSDTSGKLQIIRTGMIISAAYWDGGAYAILGSWTAFDTSVGRLKLVCYSDATGIVAAYATTFSFEDSPNSIYEGHFVAKQRGQDKISVARRGHRDYKNKITVQYTKRAYGYMAGTIDSQDLVDVDGYGLLDVNMRLEGITTLSRAEKLGRLFLKKNINQAEVYAGTLGPQSIGVYPGDVLFLSCKRLKMTNVPVRVVAIKEGMDYQLELELSEEKDVYELDTYAWDNTSPLPSLKFYPVGTDSISFSENRTLTINTISNISTAVQQISLREGINWAVVDPNQLYISGAASQIRTMETLSFRRDSFLSSPAETGRISEYANWTEATAQNDFSNDASCKALWKFESGALTTDSKGTNTLTAYNTPTATSTCNEGSAAVSLSASSNQYLAITDENLNAGFPLKNGDSSKLITVCCWFRSPSVATGTSIWAKEGWSSPASLSLFYSATGGVAIGYNTVGQYSSVTISNDTWYHAAVVVNGVNGTAKLRLYTEGGSATNYTFSSLGALTVGTADFRVGAFHDSNTTHLWNGIIDELVVFNRLLSDSEVDSIRNKTYASITVSTPIESIKISDEAARSDW